MTAPPTPTPASGPATRVARFRRWLLSPAASGYTRVCQAVWALAVTVRYAFCPTMIAWVVYFAWHHNVTFTCQAVFALTFAGLVAEFATFCAGKMMGAEWHRMRTENQDVEF